MSEHPFPFQSNYVQVFQMLISQLSLITEHSYFELGYLGVSTEIPKEHTHGFMSRGGAKGRNLGHLCNVVCICVKVFQIIIIIIIIIDLIYRG